VLLVSQLLEMDLGFLEDGNACRCEYASFPSIGLARAMLIPGKSFNARPNTRPFDQLFGDQRELIEAGYPALRQTVDRLHQPRAGAHPAGTTYRPSRPFWIGVVIGLVLVGLVFAMS
jgi:hypothetical protein